MFVWQDYYAEEATAFLIPCPETRNALTRMSGLKLLKEWMNKSIHRAFNSWLTFHKEEKRHRFVMKKILQRLGVVYMRERARARARYGNVGFFEIAGTTAPSKVFF